MQGDLEESIEFALRFGLSGTLAADILTTDDRGSFIVL